MSHQIVVTLIPQCIVIQAEGVQGRSRFVNGWAL